MEYMAYIKLANPARDALVAQSGGGASRALYWLARHWWHARQRSLARHWWHARQRWLVVMGVASKALGAQLEVFKICLAMFDMLPRPKVAFEHVFAHGHTRVASEQVVAHWLTRAASEEVIAHWLTRVACEQVVVHRLTRLASNQAVAHSYSRAASQQIIAHRHTTAASEVVVAHWLTRVACEQAAIAHNYSIVASEQIVAHRRTRVASEQPIAHSLTRLSVKFQLRQVRWGCHAAGAIVAGKEVDELIGAATLQIRGDVAARLLRGERCTLPAVLGSGASEDSGGVR
eukprot:scaffold60783_cov18-Tisochrysis_lutea.AAC.1